MCQQTTTLLLIMKMLFAYSEKEVRVASGETATLLCESVPGNTVSQWLRVSQSETESIYTDGWSVNKDLSYKERIRISSSVESGAYNLQIRNVTVNDSGVYRCIVVGGNGPRILDVALIVQDLMETSTVADDNETTTRTKVVSSSFGIERIFVAIALPCTVLAIFSLAVIIYVCITKTGYNINQVNVHDQQMWLSSVEAEQSYYYEGMINVAFNRNSIHNSITPDRRHTNNEVYNLTPINSETVHRTIEDDSGPSNHYQSLSNNWSDYTHTYSAYTPRNNCLLADTHSGQTMREVPYNV